MSTPVQKLFDLSGQTALVTGGSRGLGLQIAEALGEAGAKVMLTSRKAADLEEAAAHLPRAASMRAGSPPMPATRRRCRKSSMKRCSAWGASTSSSTTPAPPGARRPRTTRLEAWDKVMNLNIRSLFLFAQAVGKASMIPNRRGRIINIASIAGLGGSMDVKFIAYGTSKGAVVNFTRTLAAEWGAYGINVNALAPGFFPSKMTKGVLAQFGAEHLAEAAPLKRIGDDDDLKGAALLFASAAGKHITGQILAVDGGVSAVHGG